MGLLVHALTPEAARAAEPGLVALLGDAVDSSASLGCLPPLLPRRRRRRTGARRLGRSTLILDTRASERRYASMGQRVGEIPRFARSAGGALHATAFYCKLLLTTDGGTS